MTRFFINIPIYIVKRHFIPKVIFYCFLLNLWYGGARIMMNQAKSSFESFSIPVGGLFSSEKPDAFTLIDTEVIARDFGGPIPAEAGRLNHEKLQGAIEMAGAVCHEINQPLMAISGYSTLVSMSISENDPVKDKIVKIMEQVDRLGQITRKLMRITKYETKDYLEGKIIDIDRATE